MRAPMVRWREVVQSYPCEVCGAGPGDRCITYSGVEKYEAHAARSRLALAMDWELPAC